MSTAETAGEVLERLAEVIAGRRTADPGTSYVAALFDQGDQAIVRKVGEEALETVIAALDGGRHEIIHESADLLFHLLVLWARFDIAPGDVLAELARREGRSGLDEKRGRTMTGPKTD